MSATEVNHLPADLAQRYGPWALVTGAAQGLGAEFSRQLVAQQLNVVLLDIDAAALKQCAERLRQQGAGEIRTVVVDLSREDFLDELIPQLEGLSIGLLINNAGLARIGEFLLQDRAFLLKQLHVNTRATMLLTHYLGEKMVANQRGGVIILSSMAAMNGGALNANYSGTKAYDLVFAESLWSEWKPYGVDVLGFMPWATDTPGFRSELPGQQGKSGVLSVEKTVAKALSTLGKQPSASVGWMARVALLVGGLIPRASMIESTSKNIRAMLQAR